MIHEKDQLTPWVKMSLDNHHLENYRVELATPGDCDELLGLYYSIYGDDYPLEIGTNRRVMFKALQNNQFYYWPVMKDIARNIIIGSVIVEIDPDLKIGKVTGAVVHNSYRNQGIAQKLIKIGVDKVLYEKKLVNSLYATTRTESVAPQKMLIQNGFSPLGIFPNARKIKTYETLTLMGIFSDGVLSRRIKTKKVPFFLRDILTTTNFSIQDHIEFEYEPLTTFQKEENLPIEEFEFIEAPLFVEKRFEIVFKNDLESQFYPFHRPNLLIAGTKSDLEIYASFSKKDHYCVLITSNKSLIEFKNSFKSLIFSMKEVGIYYVETLVRLDNFETISFLYRNKFIPSAVYPAMREEEGKMHDYILLTRTMVPLDFSELNVESCFWPYVEQYTKLWLGMNLKALKETNPSSKNPKEQSLIDGFYGK